MEQSPSWEADQSLQLVKKFPAFLWNLEVLYRTHKWSLFVLFNMFWKLLISYKYVYIKRRQPTKRVPSVARGTIFNGTLSEMKYSEYGLIKIWILNSIEAFDNFIIKFQNNVFGT
jgi:hypothetical protein